MPRYSAESASPPSMVKDPSAVLDYVFDWAANTSGADTEIEDWLAAGETISSYTVTVAAGLTKDSDSRSGGRVTAWLSGGTAGQDYTVTCRIVTSAGRTDERSAVIRVRQR